MNEASVVLRSSELGRRIGVGAVAGLGTRLGKAVLSIASVAVLARTLPPAGFGAFLLGQTTALFGGVVAALGLENTLVREIAGLVARGEGREARAVLRRSAGLVLIGAGVVASVVVLGRDALLAGLLGEPRLAATAGWLAVWAGLDALNRLQLSALRGMHRLSAAAALDGFVHAVVFLAAVAWMASLGSVDVERAFAAAAMSSGVSVVVGWWLLRSRDPGGTAEGAARPGAAPTVATLWRRSWPLLGATSLGFIISQGDLWLVGVVAASEDAALYGSVLKLIFLVSLPLFVLNRTLSSTLAELHVRGWTSETETLLRGTTTVVTLATGVIVLALIAFGSQLLALLFGEFYAAAQPVLVILALGQLVFAASGPCGTMLMMAGHERLQLAVSLASGVYLILGSLWAGAHHGVLGVAVVVGSNAVLNNLTTLVLLRRRVGVWSHTYLTPLHAREGLRRVARLIERYAG